ncbi:MAG: YdcF family protein [Clostridiaceae bacterium]|nr:YdcF family protein [Clostridiaceae bacterium]
MKKIPINYIKKIKTGGIVLITLGILGISTLAGINFYIKYTVSDNIYSLHETDSIKPVDCITVLGAGLKADGTPNYMLQDRLDTAIALYQAGVSDRLLMTGDHGQENYDEVSAMKQYAVDAGVPADQIFLDHAGFSTYESAYRAAKIFEVKSTVVITQKYHMYRSLYDFQKMGIDADGVCAKEVTYSGQWVRSSREILARAKDLFYTITKPKPTYLGDSIPITSTVNKSN